MGGTSLEFLRSPLPHPRSTAQCGIRMAETCLPPASPPRVLAHLHPFTGTALQLFIYSPTIYGTPAGYPEPCQEPRREEQTGLSSLRSSQSSGGGRLTSDWVLVKFRVSFKTQFNCHLLCRVFSSSLPSLQRS